MSMYQIEDLVEASVNQLCQVAISYGMIFIIFMNFKISLIVVLLISGYYRNCWIVVS